MTKSKEAMMERLTALYSPNSFIVKVFKELCENTSIPDSDLERIVQAHESHPVNMSYVIDTIFSDDFSEKTY